MSDTLQQLNEAERRTDGRISQEARDAILNAGRPVNNKPYLRFHRLNLLSAIKASCRYRECIADGRFDSLSTIGRLKWRVNLMDMMLASGTQYLGLLIGDAEIERQSSEAQAAE